MILLSKSSWRDCFQRSCFLTIFSLTATACFPRGYYQYGKFEVITAKNYQYLRNCKKRRFCRRKFANTRSTKALSDYYALAESQPTSATLATNGLCLLQRVCIIMIHFLLDSKHLSLWYQPKVLHLQVELCENNHFHKVKLVPFLFAFLFLAVQNSSIGLIVRPLLGSSVWPR